MTETDQAKGSPNPNPTPPQEPMTIEKMIEILDPDVIEDIPFTDCVARLLFGNPPTKKTRGGLRPDTEICSGQASGRHDMEYLGDSVFQCRYCEHSEIGCSHGRTGTENGQTVCLICHETLKQSG